MIYAVLLHPKAAKELQALDEPMRTRIRNRLRELGSDPEKTGKKLKYSDYWSLRIGDYRAIYEISEEKRQVIVLFVGHNKNVYDDFSKLF
jgi:mRNA interferase RelE/StbE